MNNKLENFDIFMCDKCGDIILVKDVYSMNLASSHGFKCIFNKKLVKNYNRELKECTLDIEYDLVHKKYINLL